MMNNIGKLSNGEAKDRILEFALSINKINDNFSYSSIQKHLFPNKSIEYVKVLVKEIHDFSKETIRLKIGRHEVYLLSNGSAKSFLNNGGFSNFEFVKERQEQKENLDFKVSKFKYYTFWWFFGFALIGFALSIYNFIDNLSSSQDLEKEEQIEKIQMELKKLRTFISKQENRDSLQSNRESIGFEIR